MNPDGNLGICWERWLLIPSSQGSSCSISAAGKMSAELVLMENRSKHSLIASSASPRPLCTKQLPLLSHLVGNSSGTLQGSDDFPAFFKFFFPCFCSLCSWHSFSCLCPSPPPCLVALALSLGEGFSWKLLLFLTELLG